MKGVKSSWNPAKWMGLSGVKQDPTQGGGAEQPGEGGAAVDNEESAKKMAALEQIIKTQNDQLQKLSGALESQGVQVSHLMQNFQQPNPPDKKPELPFEVPSYTEDQWNEMDSKTMMLDMAKMLTSAIGKMNSNFDERFDKFLQYVNNQYGNTAWEQLKARNPEAEEWKPELEALAQKLGQNANVSGEDMLAIVKAQNPEKDKKLTEQYQRYGAGNDSRFNFGAPPDEGKDTGLFTIEDYDPSKGSAYDQIQETVVDYLNARGFDTIEQMLDTEDDSII